MSRATIGPRHSTATLSVRRSVAAIVRSTVVVRWTFGVAWRAVASFAAGAVQRLFTAAAPAAAASFSAAPTLDATTTAAPAAAASFSAAPMVDASAAAPVQAGCALTAHTVQDLAAPASPVLAASFSVPRSGLSRQRITSAGERRVTSSGNVRVTFDFA